MKSSEFFGARVVLATFVLAMFGWGIGFYGPPIYLYAVIQRTGWSVELCSAAVTLHFLAGTLVIANLPRLYRRFGIPRVTVTGTLSLVLGVFGWAVAVQPWQLFLAATLSGLGWVTLGAAAVNAIISPWFVAKRPAALAMAYNGASLGGVVFSSAWVFLIARLGFAPASLLVGALALLVIGFCAWRVFRFTPERLGQQPDGLDAPSAAVAQVAPARTLAGRALWTDRRFLSLAAGMALGLFAQIGLIAHLFLLLVPRLGEQQAGLAMGLATLCAIVGRTLVGACIRPGTNRRTVACMSYGVQLLGCLALLMADAHVALVWLGVALFGVGIGNATSLPPLIAQSEFERGDVPRVVALIVAMAQGCYAFAPAIFGVLLAMGDAAAASSALFIGAGAVQLLAILALSLGGAARGVTAAARQQALGR
ncbi:MFS family permease [Pseudomonas alcaligenes]|nr:MFS family permease [Pseudomonas alcaligenes]